MESLSIPLILDILLILMLAASIGYCVSLSRKLSVMRDAQSELHKVAAEFDRAIVKSKLGIEELRKTSEELGGGLQKEVNEAKALLEELKLINVSSSRIADRLQESVDGAGKKISSTQSPEPPVDEPEETSSPGEPRTEAERELLQMLTKSK